MKGNCLHCLSVTLRPLTWDSARSEIFVHPKDAGSSCAISASLILQQICIGEQNQQ